ncbi:MAG: amidohydrolase [Streptococcus salivarius]
MTEAFYDHLAKTRHQIHQHPEVSEEEHETTVFLKGYLRNLGIEPLNYPLKTGLIAEIGSGHPIIALRADIDALPIKEKTGLPYASDNGAMHACGHDFHQTSLLGAAQILKEREAELKGTVRLIFQPAEENFQGAYQVIEAGGLDGVSAIIGYHNNPHLKPGQIGLRSGAIMAGVEQFRVDVKGVSSHAARPDLGVDTVLVTTTIINNYNRLWLVRYRPLNQLYCQLLISKLEIPGMFFQQQAFFEGTIRTFEPKVREDVIARFEKVVQATADQFDAQVDITWGNSPYVTYNDQTLTPLIFENSKAFRRSD